MAPSHRTKVVLLAAIAAFSQVALAVQVGPGDRVRAREDERAALHERETTRELSDGPVRLVPMTRKNLEKLLPDQHSAQAIEEVVDKRQWKPSEKWLSTEGKKYGRLVIVSDIHPGSGEDPVTGKVSPLEHFMPDRQEVDFHRMLESEWKGAKDDGVQRTLVLNGDNFEFMLQTRAAEGQEFEGPKDSYGPLNTARVVIEKLKANREGHPGLFSDYAAQLEHGHRIVILPGNHDRQLLHPAVRAALRGIIRKDLVAALEKDVAFQPELTGDARHAAAISASRSITNERLEFQPHYFMVGDVFVQHGHQTDPENSFTTLLGDFYGKPTRDTPMEGAFGDYFVKAVFNTVEAKVPWGASGNANKLEVAHEAMSAKGGRVMSASKLVRALGYVATREGHGTEADAAAIDAQQRTDIERVVKQYGMTEKFNELRQGQEPLTEAQVVDRMLEYQQLQAEPILNLFAKDSGLVSRGFTALRNVSAITRTLSDDAHTAREEAANAFLFGKFGIKTHTTGHDHLFRLQRYLVGEKGKERMGEMLDDATWIDTVPGANSRNEIAQTSDMRGVITVDFTASGSHAKLSHWDPVRRELTPVSVLEDPKEALGKE